MLHLCLCALLLRLCAPLGVPNSPPLHFHDQVRQRHLYTESSRRGLFLEIAPDGAVRGTPVQTLNSVLELRSVQAGQTVIQGVRSSLYLCVDGDGHLRGRRRYTEADCTFRELLLADGYTVFLSPHHGLPITLASKVSVTNRPLPFSHFLPVRNSVTLGGGPEGNRDESLSQPHSAMDLDSQDPLGMEPGHADMVGSPGFLRRK
uniref:Fibroblast growth factor n=2 Tax=Scleropages formosus TaxID=113540 RepID=A0A8C9R1B4_SCLFO